MIPSEGLEGGTAKYVDSSFLWEEVEERKDDTIYYTYMGWSIPIAQFKKIAFGRLGTRDRPGPGPIEQLTYVDRELQHGQSLLMNELNR